MMNPLLRSFALSVYSGLIRGSATDFRFPRKPNPPKFRPLHQARATRRPRHRTNPFTGPRRTTYHSKTARPAAPCATACSLHFSSYVANKRDCCQVLINKDLTLYSFIFFSLFLHAAANTIADHFNFAADFPLSCSRNFSNSPESSSFGSQTGGYRKGRFRRRSFTRR